MVLLKEIKDAIWKLFTSKAVRPDRILNKVIKAALKAVATPLVNTITTYFLKSNLLEYYKEIITVIL